MGCPKIAYRAKSKPVLRCIWNVKNQPKQGVNCYDYGARFYDPAIGRFTTQDPLSTERYWVSPYNYVQNNPIMRIDPTGALDDWVQNNQTKEYEWMDNVKGPDDTPEGYSYVGESGTDILNDLNLSSDFDFKTATTNSFGLVGDDKVGAPVGSRADATGSISLTADIAFNTENITEENSMGKTFVGVTVEANFTQSSLSGAADLKTEYSGNLLVKQGNTMKTSLLSSPSQPYMNATGSKSTQSRISFSSSELSNNGVLKSATINAGATNPALLISPKPISMTWQLQRTPIYIQD